MTESIINFYLKKFLINNFKLKFFSEIVDYITYPPYEVYNFSKSCVDDINTMFVCNQRKGRKRKRGREGERKKKEEKKFYKYVWI